MTPIRSIAFALVAGSVLACATAPMEPVGYTPLGNAPKAAAPAPSASSSARPWANLEAARSWPKANAKRFVSAGHLFGRYEADIRVNDTGKEGYSALAPGARLPVGTMIALFLASPDGTQGPTFAMEKEASGWAYVETDARGGMVRRGRLSPCVECHAHVADQDELFGVPLTGR
ncbi:MAG: hypothetical protein ACXVEF_03255 [Polyangiales bacterium]